MAGLFLGRPFLRRVFFLGFFATGVRCDVKWRGEEAAPGKTQNAKKIKRLTATTTTQKKTQQVRTYNVCTYVNTTQSRQAGQKKAGQQSRIVLVRFHFRHFEIIFQVNSIIATTIMFKVTFGFVLDSCIALGSQTFLWFFISVEFLKVISLVRNEIHCLYKTN